MELSILGWIVVGLVAGGLAKLVIPGDDPGGCIVTMLIGIAGGVLGGFLSTALFDVEAEGVSIPSILIAMVGAIILLLIYRMVVRRRRS